MTVYHCSDLFCIIVVAFGISGRGNHPGEKGRGAEAQCMAQRVNRLINQKAVSSFPIVLFCNVFTSVIMG